MTPPSAPLTARTWRAPPGAGPHELEAWLEAQRRQPVHVRLYGRPGSVSLDVPLVSKVEGEPCAGGSLAGAHVLFADPDASLRVFDGGVRIDQGSRRAVVLAGITGRGPTPIAELTAMFDRADSLLVSQGMTFADVGRTWLHMPELLRDYDALNLARNEFFEARGIGRELAPPASTGIGGGAPAGAIAQLDLVAAAGHEPLRAGAQCEAWEYGSAFSRGMAVGSLLSISGTASIDKAGATAEVGDPRGQILRTWSIVSDLLARNGSGLRIADAPAIVLYFKDPSVWQAWQDLRQEGQLAALPQAVAVHADVCRDDLLFEMELSAAP